MLSTLLQPLGLPQPLTLKLLTIIMPTTRMRTDHPGRLENQLFVSKWKLGIFNRSLLATTRYFNADCTGSTGASGLDYTRLLMELTLLCPTDNIRGTRMNPKHPHRPLQPNFHINADPNIQLIPNLQAL